MTTASLTAKLLAPDRLWRRADVLVPSCPVPSEPGVYTWFFAPPPPGVPIDGCVTLEGAVLLYVGISPKQPPANGRAPSRQRLRQRIRYHYRGNAEGSTLRLTLGCLLAEQLEIELRRVGSGRRRTFGPDGELRLSAWLDKHAFVAWLPHPAPWELEDELIKTLSLPLNLQGNQHHPFHRTLSAVRAAAKQRADVLPILRGP